MRASRWALGAPISRAPVSLALGFALLAASGCSDAPADGDCEKLMDHLVELKLSEVSPAEDEVEEIRKKLHESMSAKFQKRCETELRSAQVQCALKATTTKAIDACES